jgi:hypothetical protein
MAGGCRRQLERAKRAAHATPTPPPRLPGFVPPCNPHDEAELAPNLQAALEQLWQIQAAAAAAGGGGGGGPAWLAAAYSAALSAGQAELQAEVEAALAGPPGGGGAGDDGEGGGNGGGGGRSGVEAEATISALEVIKVAAGSRVSNSLAAALEVIAAANAANAAAAGGAAAAEEARAASSSSATTSGGKRAVPGGDAGGIGAAAAAASEVPPEGTVEFLMGALLWLALRVMPTPLLVDLSAALLDAAGRTEADGGAAAAAAGVQLRHYQELLSPPRPGSSSSGGASSGTAADDLLTLAEGILAGAGGAAARLAPPLRPELRMAVAYRASKKMVLTDALAAVAQALGLGVPQLEEELATWAGRARGARAPPPPWRAAAAEVQLL